MAILKVIFYIVLIQFYNWFTEPYKRYKSRKQVKEYEIYENGKPKSKKELGTPFLLREGAKDVELVGLGLVIPCYNE